jgi:hypothetical protein
MKLRGFRDHDVWRRSRALAIEVYQITALAHFRSDWESGAPR